MPLAYTQQNCIHSQVTRVFDMVMSVVLYMCEGSTCPGETERKLYLVEKN